MTIETNMPSVEFKHVELPRTNLHYMKAGNGPPLIIVPALISRLHRWQALAQFLGQKFTTYFFELPGHGGSTAYPERFHSHLVPETVEAFVNKLGIDRFTLMGFSFGGLLSMRTLKHLLPRIDRLILLSPALSKRAILFSKRKVFFLKVFCSLLRFESMQKLIINFMNNENTFEKFATMLSNFSNIDKKIILEIDPTNFPQSTLDVLSAEIQEVLHLELDPRSNSYSLPCFFGMSINDDLIDFDTTLNVAESLFSDLSIVKFTMPYHQPPKLYTFDEYNSKYGDFLDILTRGKYDNYAETI